MRTKLIGKHLKWCRAVKKLEHQMNMLNALALQKKRFFALWKNTGLVIRKMKSKNGTTDFVLGM